MAQAQSKRTVQPTTDSVVPIKIENRSYAKFADQPLFITHQLKEALEKRRVRDGSAFEGLRRMGFRGGKHLMEMIRAQLGSECGIVLSHDACALENKLVTIDYEAFRESGSERFFQVYRQTGLRTATGFLHEAFPATFRRTEADLLPETTDVKRVLARLPEAAATLSKRERKQLPAQLAELVERQGPEFVLDLLRSVDAAIPKGQERIRVAFQDVIKRLSREPAKALHELSDLMDQWNLMQVTSLVNVLRGRIQTIETFEDTVFPWMHVRGNVEFALKVKDVPKSRRREISDRWLEAVGLSSFAESWPRELSGGMRKRVALAAVLASDAAVWLMDEPFGSLDYFTRRGLHDMLIKLWIETEKTVFFVTHDIEESLILADRILVLNEGCLVEDIPVRLTRPRTEEVRASSEAVDISKTILERLGFASGPRLLTASGAAE